MHRAVAAKVVVDFEGNTATVETLYMFTGYGKAYGGAVYIGGGIVTG